MSCVCDIFFKTESTSDAAKDMNEAQNHSVDVKAGAVEYLSAGDPFAEETVVILHASATGAATMTGLAQSLASRYHVLIPNLDGYGFTKLDCAKCPATFRHVQAVERFLSALQIEKLHLIGHSMGGLIALRLARRARFELKSLVLIEPMAFGVLDEVADKDAIDFDRAMINDFLGAVSAGNFEDGLSVFTERVSGQNWDDLTEKARVELMAVIPQIVEEAPLVSCDDLNSDNFSQISVPTFLLGTEMGPPPAAPIIERISAALPNSSRQTLSGMGHMAPVTHAGAVGDAIETFYGTLER